MKRRPTYHAPEPARARRHHLVWENAMVDEPKRYGPREPAETAALKIAKLRWLGLEHEAKDLAHTLERNPLTGECLCEPVNTD